MEPVEIGLTVGIVATLMLISVLLWKEMRNTRRLPARQLQPTQAASTQPGIGDLAHGPRIGSVGDRPWVRTRMSNGDMFALGFYGGLGFAVATTIMWVAVFSMLIPLALALAGGSR